MRVIKFRAWDRKAKKMFYPNSINLREYGGDHAPLQFEHSGRKGISHSAQVRGEELMQYTGLKDRNGVEIYEGDIVKGYGEIVYGGGDYPAFHFEPCNCEETNDLQLAVLSGECEVIGNIYESPELLK